MYSTSVYDNYIKSYANKLLNIEFPKDNKLLIKLADYLLNWSMSKLDDNKSSDFVVSKEVYMKSYEILINSKELLRENN